VIDETVALDLSRRGAAPEDNAALVTLSAVAQARQHLHLRYRSREQQDNIERQGARSRRLAGRRSATSAP
jgi:hypothetical protein